MPAEWGGQHSPVPAEWGGSCSPVPWATTNRTGKAIVVHLVQVFDVHFHLLALMKGAVIMHLMESVMSRGIRTGRKSVLGGNDEPRTAKWTEVED